MLTFPEPDIYSLEHYLGTSTVWHCCISLLSFWLLGLVSITLLFLWQCSVLTCLISGIFPAGEPCLNKLVPSFQILGSLWITWSGILHTQHPDLSICLPQVRPLLLLYSVTRNTGPNMAGYSRSHCYTCSRTRAGNCYCHAGKTNQQVNVGWCAMWCLSKMPFTKYLNNFSQWSWYVSWLHFKLTLNYIATHNQ